jgi:cytochrome c oxidase subunit II
MKQIWIGMFATLMVCLLLAQPPAAQLTAAQSVAVQSPAEEGRVHEIKMTAKKYEFSPSEIHVKQGEKVRLLITALDRKHGFEIKPLGIKTDLEQGKEQVVEFQASQSGEFEFHCSNFCGLGHGRMKGKLIVEPAG